MRKAVLAALVLFAAANLFAASPTPGCNQASLLISGIQGEMQAPCSGAIAFTTASYTPPSTTGSGANGSGAGAGSITPGSLKVVKPYDMSSPGLLLACANGKHIQTVTLTYPNAQTPVNVVFSDVLVASINESVNPTNESLEFKYSKILIQSGNNTSVNGNVLGGARPSSLKVALVGSDGKSQTVNHASITVRAGGTTFDSVQLAPPPPGMPTARAGVVKPTHANEGPEESIHLNYGKIVMEYKQQKEGFEFHDGKVVNGNLRVSRASYTGPTTLATHPQ